NMFNAFRATKLKDEPERAKSILTRAEEASKVAGELSGYVDSLKTLLEQEGGGRNESTGDIRNRDHLNSNTRVMVKQDEKRAEKLRKRSVQTRQRLMELSNNGVNFSLDAQDQPARSDKKKSWEQAKFDEGVPLTAAITVLEKITA